MAKPNKSTAESPLLFEKQACITRKISNNLQKWGDGYVKKGTGKKPSDRPNRH